MRRSSLVLLTLAGALAVGPRVAHADTRAEARRYFLRGMEAIKEGRHADGIELLLKAYEIKPHPNVLYNVGRAYVALGNLDAAIDYFERYVATDPPDHDGILKSLDDLRSRQRLRSLVDDGMSAIAAGRYSEGIGLLQKAYQERPHANLLFNIGRAFEDAGDLDNAIKNYDAYVASSPPDSASVEARIRGLREKLEAQRASRTPPVVSTAPQPREQRPLPAAGGDDARRVAEQILAMVRAGLPEGPSATVNLAPVGGGAKRTGGGAREAPTSTTAIENVPIENLLEAKAAAGYEEVVVTASRREQSPLDAPNAVTIITDEDIRLSGARTLPDLLRRVPGMDVMAMTASDWNLSMRGFNRRVANKILVLVDGRTVYQDYIGAVLWAALSFSLEDIQRIEIVRGPGSAIYGSYAYTGIINILLKRPEAVNGAMVYGGGGNANTVEGVTQYGFRRGAVGFRGSAGYIRADKYEQEFDPARVDFTTNTKDPTRSLDKVRGDGTIEYNLKGGGHFFVGAGANSGIQEFYGISAIRDQRIDGLSLNVRGGYTDDLFSVLTFWDTGQFKSSPEFYPTGESDLGSNVRGDLFSVEPVFRPTFSLGGEHSLVLGGEYKHKSITWNYLDSSHDEDHVAIFAQDSWTISKSFTALVSARLDKHPLIGFLGSPRLALIYKPTSGQAIRASFGTAFRTPTLAENYLAIAAASPIAGIDVLVAGNKNLKPERIITADFGYLNQGDFGSFEAVGYVNRVDNLITRTSVIPNGLDQGFNAASGGFIAGSSESINDPAVYIAVGGELATRLNPLDGLDIGASVSLNYIFNQANGQRFTDSPIGKGTLWVQLRTRFGMDVGASVHLTSDQAWIEPQFDMNGQLVATPQPIPTAVVAIGRVAYRLFDDKLELAVTGTNLTDIGNDRHLEHPYANHLEARVLGSVTARF
jgi:iron complex outermembrane receptor protein